MRVPAVLRRLLSERRAKAADGDDVGSTGRPRACIVRQYPDVDVLLRREADAYVDAGFDVDVLIPDGGGADPAGLGFTVHRLSAGEKSDGNLGYLIYSGRFLLACARRLLRLHRRHPIRIVLVNTMPDFLVFATVPVKALGARVMVFMKEPTPELGYTLSGSRLVERAFLLVEKAALAYADGALTVTDQLRQTFIDRGADPTALRVVVNSPDPSHVLIDEPPSPRPEDRFVVVCHGTIEERWGHETMIRAIDIARRTAPDVMLRLTGRGEYVGQMLRLIAELDVADHVDYLGWVSFEEMIGVVRSADAGIVAQKANAYSHLVHTGKMYEYIVLGVPVIASRLRATADAFDDDCLEFFEPDDPSSLAAAILALRDDPERRRRLAQHAGARYRRDFGWGDQKRVLIDASLDLLVET